MRNGREIDIHLNITLNATHDTGEFWDFFFYLLEQFAIPEDVTRLKRKYLNQMTRKEVNFTDPLVNGSVPRTTLPNNESE